MNLKFQDWLRVNNIQRKSHLTHLQPQHLIVHKPCLLLLLHPAVLVFEADDIVFTEILSALYFDHH